MNRHLSTSFSLSLALALPVLLFCTGCGSGMTGNNGGETPAPRLNLALNGTSTIKIRSNARGTLLLAEKPVSIFTQAPLRELRLVTGNGTSSRLETLPAGWHLLDFAQHPSGDISLVLSTATQLRLMRFNASGTLIADSPLLDAKAATDPYIATDLQSPHDASSMQPILMRDAARLAPLGEDLAIAIRTGLNAVITYRYRLATNSYTPVWRTLVEPGTDIGGRALVNGTHDVMGQLENHLRVLLDTDSDNNIAIAVNATPYDSVFEAHNSYFKEPVPQTPGLIVTRLSPSGQRLGSTVVNTSVIAEAHGLRVLNGTVAVTGRVRTERRSDGTGWDAYLALISSSSGALRSYRVLDIDRGDVLFDILPDGAGTYLASGTTGYTQNPSGASISEEAQPLLLRLNTEGVILNRITVPTAPRHNSIRSLTSSGSNILLGGMQNGPGTHSNDGAPDSITADGFVRTLD